VLLSFRMVLTRSGLRGPDPVFRARFPVSGSFSVDTIPPHLLGEDDTLILLHCFVTFIIEWKARLVGGF
jgi:hypothetical protein